MTDEQREVLPEWAKEMAAHWQACGPWVPDEDLTERGRAIKAAFMEMLASDSRYTSPDTIREAVAGERERCAKIAERTANQSERRVEGEPLRAKYSKTIAEADRATAVELRDVALLIREGVEARA